MRGFRKQGSWVLFTLSFWISTLPSTLCLAETTLPARSETSAEPDLSTADKPKPKKSKGARREKEAEGTKAPNRFETDINTKSKYNYGGRPLEVDTD